ncbi:hypothetical protein DIPPA_01751 [Diplonema papillatum]|nr:hypothetical protein DIPPA_01751 [Diplonema papillatum]
MELGPATPPPPSMNPPPPTAPPAYESDIIRMRQQMFPLILTTYGIPTDSERARSLAMLLGLSERAPVIPTMPPRIEYHPHGWRGHGRGVPLIRFKYPFNAIPDDVLSHILSYEFVPRILMWQWFNVSQQWRRCLFTPLLGYYDFLRLTRCHATNSSIAQSPSPTPRPYAVRIEVMRCMRCDKLSINEFCDGTMWGHCVRCGMDGQFDNCYDDPRGNLLLRFPSFVCNVQGRHQNQTS